MAFAKGFLVDSKMLDRRGRAPEQATGDGTPHDSIDLILGDSGETGRPSHGARLLQQLNEMAFKAAREASAFRCPWHADHHGAPALKLNAGHACGDDGFAFTGVKMPPGALLPVFDQRTGLGFGIDPGDPPRTFDANVDLLGFRRNGDSGHLPGRFEPQRLPVKCF